MEVIVQELNMQEMDDVSGGHSVFWWGGYYTGALLEWARMPREDVTWYI